MDANVMVTRRRINAAFLLGVVVLARPGCASVNGPSGLLPGGQWGGDHIAIDVAATDASVEFDCAYGRIYLPVLLEDGDFVAEGTYTQEQGGPIREDDPPVARPARYSGRVRGPRMTLNVVLPGENRAVGTFELRHGSPGRVFKCL
jgi:hypothetical protein